jgi:hypothetical protein
VSAKSKKPHSFTRIFALIRSALWQKIELRSLLERYGTADGGGRFLGTPQQPIWPASVDPMGLFQGDKNFD